ncbi:MAG: hypothetical protein ACI9J0_002269, partial [Cryomorphaceae bacterium]
MDFGKQITSTFCVCFFMISGLSYADPREQAKRIHDRLTGVPATDAMLDAMEAAIRGSG